MKLILISLSLFSYITAYANIVAEVAISPAGSFSVSSGAIKGQLTHSDNGFTAKKLSIKVKSLKTGMELRDKHLKEKLKSNVHPSVSLYKIVAKNGKGSGELKIKNIKKKISFTYKKVGSKVVAKFSVNLADYKIDGINYMGVGVKDIVEITAQL